MANEDSIVHLVIRDCSSESTVMLDVMLCYLVEVNQCFKVT
jgi:hypothetical protein